MLNGGGHYEEMGIWDVAFPFSADCRFWLVSITARLLLTSDGMTFIIDKVVCHVLSLSFLPNNIPLTIVLVISGITKAVSARDKGAKNELYPQES